MALRVLLFPFTWQHDWKTLSITWTATLPAVTAAHWDLSRTHSSLREKLEDRSAASRDRYQKDGLGGQTINIVLGGADKLSSTGWFKDESKATIQRAKVKSIIIKSTWELIKQSMTKQNSVRGTGNEFLIPLWFGVSGVFNYIDMKRRDTLFLTHHCNLG